MILNLIVNNQSLQVNVQVAIPCLKCYAGLVFLVLNMGVKQANAGPVLC